MIENFEYVTSLLSDSSSLVSDYLNQLAVVLVQGSQESVVEVEQSLSL